MMLRRSVRFDGSLIGPAILQTEFGVHEEMAMAPARAEQARRSHRVGREAAANETVGRQAAANETVGREAAANESIGRQHSAGLTPCRC
jgi:hypothetical protein